MLSPAGLSILTTTFTEGKERNKALGIWGAACGSGGAAGVLLGGALTSGLNGSWIFFINVSVGILVIALTPVLLRESRAELEDRHFHFSGAASITGGLMLLVYGMTREFRWSDVTDLGGGKLMMGVVPQSAWAFLLRDGCSIRAQATPSRPDVREAESHALLALAPAIVQFHRPSDW